MVGRLARDDSGAVAVIAAISLLAMLLMSAVVIDLGFLRSDRVASQSVSDMAATAAAVDYRPGVAGSAQQACFDGLAYAADNLEITFDAAAATAACEAAFPTSFDENCDPAAPTTATYADGPYRISLTIPVGDDHHLMEQHAQRDDAFDGDPCQRIGVEIERDRTLILGGLTTSGNAASTERGAVSRSLFGDDETDYASLIVLKRGPSAPCTSLETGGGSEIRVLNLVRDELNEETGELEEVTYPGNITVDTLPAATCNTGRIISLDGNNSAITAEGDIVAHALSSADPGNTRTYDAPSGSQELTTPIPGPRITRAPVDHEFNCHPGGYPTGFDWSPDRYGQDIEPCDDATPTYVADLQDAFEDVDGDTAGFATFPDDFDGYECTGNGVLDPIAPADAGGLDQLYVDCDVTTGQGFVAGGGSLTFEDFRHIVFRRTVRMNSSGTFAIRGPSPHGTIAYIQQGSLNHADGTMLLDNTFVYLQGSSTATSGNNIERLRVGGSTGSRYAHRAPLDRDACLVAGGVPNAACFAPLALWSNGIADNILQGDNSNGGIVGSVFTPNAHTRLRTSNPDSTETCGATPSFSDLETAPGGGLNLEAAQFFAVSIENRNGGVMRMCPNPDTNVEIPLRGVSLIR